MVPIAGARCAIFTPEIWIIPKDGWRQAYFLHLCVYDNETVLLLVTVHQTSRGESHNNIVLLLNMYIYISNDTSSVNEMIVRNTLMTRSIIDT